MDEIILIMINWSLGSCQISNASLRFYVNCKDKESITLFFPIILLLEIFDIIINCSFYFSCPFLENGWRGSAHPDRRSERFAQREPIVDLDFFRAGWLLQIPKDSSFFHPGGQTLSIWASVFFSFNDFNPIFFQQAGIRVKMRLSSSIELEEQGGVSTSSYIQVGISRLPLFLLLGWKSKKNHLIINLVVISLIAKVSQTFNLCYSCQG